MEDMGASPKGDRAGRASHGAAKASPPSGDHPLRVTLELCRGQAGDALYLGDYRIAGPRHNGVMHTVARWTISEADILDALAEVRL